MLRDRPTGHETSPLYKSPESTSNFPVTKTLSPPQVHPKPQNKVMLLRLKNLLSPPSTTSGGGVRSCISALHVSRSYYATGKEPKEDANGDYKGGKWFTLPPFTPVLNGAALGKEISCGRAQTKSDATTVTALKWVLRCCPELPRSLIQKLFRLRQVLAQIFHFETLGFRNFRNRTSKKLNL
jgi:hypothetical protein